MACSSDCWRAAIASSRTCFADQCVACSASVASVSGFATSTSGLTWSKESFPCDRASEILGSSFNLVAAVTHSRAVAAATPHCCTNQATIDVAPSTRQALRRSSSTTAANSWLWWAEMARWCWITLATRRSVRRETESGRGPSRIVEGVIDRRMVAALRGGGWKPSGTPRRLFSGSDPPAPTPRGSARGGEPAGGSRPQGPGDPWRRRRGRRCRSCPG